MSYTLGQAAKVVGMSKTSILRSIKAGRISAGRDEFGQWAIESCELHRVYPALTEDTVMGNGTGERAVTGAETARAEANARAAIAEARLFDFKTMLDDIREQRDRWQQQAERLAALAITDQRKEPAPRCLSHGGDGCELERHRQRAAWNGCGDISRRDPDRGLGCCRGAGA